MRKSDTSSLDFNSMRSDSPRPKSRVILPPGNLMVPDENLAVAAVVASAVVVTLFDIEKSKGGVCHFIKPWPKADEVPTPVFGLPACAALISEFVNRGSKPESLKVGIYGGAWPEWANAEQRKLSRENIEVVRDVMAKKKIKITDEDVGGSRGRKIVYVTRSNEIAVVKTDSIRNSDWYPEISLKGK